MDESKNPKSDAFDLFTSECNDTDPQVRINAVRNLPIVAVVLGKEKTISKLMPFLETLTEGLYNNDEVLLILTEQLGDFLPYVGGTENAHVVLNILEKLGSIEENLVRQKAIESLNKIVQMLDETTTETVLIPLLLRLVESEWFTSKSTATAMFSICYPKISNDLKTDLRNAYRVLCQDDSPLVRRSAALRLTEFTKVLELQFMKDEFIPVFDNLSKDDQDSVRVLAVDVGISIASRLIKKEVEDFILTTLIELAGDASWRVRYKVAYRINQIQEVMGYEMTRKYLVGIYQNLVHDDEPQVREVGAKNIVKFCETLQQTYVKENNNNNQIDPTILNEMFQMIYYLDEDVNPEVKEALLLVITSLSSVVGVENAKRLLLPLITNSLLNDSSKVRENIISNLNKIISVIGITDIADTVLKVIFELVNNSASVWRTRRNLIITISYIARQSGKEYFDTNLKVLYHKLLSDRVCAVRKTAPLILPILIKTFGFKWALKSIVPLFLIFSEDINYLYRFVCLFCIDELVTPTLENNLDDSQGKNSLKYLNQIWNIITKQNEPEEVINKTKDVLKRINRLNRMLNIKINEEEWILNGLELVENDISKDDIIWYAEETIEIFKQDHNINIMSITKDEILLNENDIYLEGVLELILNKILTVLRSLYKDPVPNIQLKVAKTLNKIVAFNKSLSCELEKEWARETLTDDNNDQWNSENNSDVIKILELKENKDDNRECENMETKIEKIEDNSMEAQLIEILEEKLPASNNLSGH